MKYLLRIKTYGDNSVTHIDLKIVKNIKNNEESLSLNTEIEISEKFNP